MVRGVCLCFGTLVFAASLAADDGASPRAPTDRAGALGDWPLETVRTTQGETLRGYVQSITAREIELVQVLRPPGRDMSLVVRPLPRDRVAAIERLPEEERRRLAERVRQFRHRASIEAGAVEAIALGEVMHDGRRFLAYDGPWFTLHSTGDDDTTRRTAVRIEQLSLAYRYALPPRRQPRDRLRIVFYASMEQYRSYLHETRLDIVHPAFYSAPTNTIVAGADLAHYAERLRHIRAENQRLRDEHAAANQSFGQRQRELAERLKQAGFTQNEIRDELLVRRKAWEEQYAALLRKLDEIDRRNDGRFAEASQQAFARLAHEAFHAYLENYLYPRRDHAFPRWLNEGLAQVFESGRLEGETLRIDAPDGERLRLLQADLLREPMPLIELLEADDGSFLISHARADASQRRYLYAWGLAWYLLTEHGLTEGDALTQYVSASESMSAVERFERFASAPLPEFERRWRETMLSAQATPR